MSRARCCLACGARLATVRENGRPRRRCPRCGWTFYDNPVPAAIAIVRRGDRLLMARRARPPYAGTWDLPGGFLEAGESPEAGLRRELKEELGIETSSARLVAFATDRYGPGGFPILTLVYEVVPAPGSAPTAADDVAEVRWFPLAALPFSRIAFPGLRTSLRSWVATRHPRARRGRRPRTRPRVRRTTLLGGRRPARG